MQATQAISHTGAKAKTFAVLNIVAGGLLFVAPWVRGNRGAKVFVRSGGGI